MRVSTSQMYSVANIGMRDAQTEVDKTQQQITTGKRVLSPADDPVAATGILSINQELARTSQFGKNIDIANNNLSLEDTTLQSVVSLVQRLKELAVNAGNTAVLTKSDYQAISAEVDSRLNELMNLQNTRNSSGQYIYAGFQSEKQPFVDNGGGNYSYQGDEGQLYVQASTSVKVAVSDSGKKVFMDIPSSQNTFITKAGPLNKSSPAAIISVGQVVDQPAFDKLYPEDMLVTFNAISAVVPPSPNYTVTERSTGKILADKQVYISGQDITVSGAKFSISGSPYAGTPATKATIPLGAFAPTDFSLVNSSIDITVGGVTETLKLDTNITANSGADSLNNLITALGGGDKTFYDIPINAGTNAAQNFKKLQNLGITFNGTGFSSPNGLNIAVKNGSPATDAVTGIATSGSGSLSPNIPFSFGTAFDFSTLPEKFDLTVNGKTATITLNANVTNATTLAAAINDPNNLAALSKLGVIATSAGLSSVNNSVITLSNAGPEVLTAMGLAGATVSSTQGVLAKPGDTFIIESSGKQGLLTTVSRFSDAMKNVDNTQVSKDQLAKMIATTLANLENSITNIASVQGEVGARQNMLDSSKELNTDIELNGKQVLSQIQDLDYAEASTRLQMQSFVLSATQQSFVKISELSLFKYM